MNERITAPRVRLVRDNEQLGIMTIDEAQRLADEAGLDLVEIAPTADPPVCRIMDYGKFKYEQAKRDRESRKASKQVELREVRMKVKIDTHDLDFKVRNARKLLAEGDKVKVSVMFRAREITHPEVGRGLLDRFYEAVRDVATVEREPALEGRFMSMTLGPGVKKPARQRPDAAANGAASDGANNAASNEGASGSAERAASQEPAEAAAKGS